MAWDYEIGSWVPSKGEESEGHDANSIDAGAIPVTSTKPSAYSPHDRRAPTGLVDSSVHEGFAVEDDDADDVLLFDVDSPAAMLG